MDGRPADLPGDAVGGVRHAGREPQRPRAAVPPRERDRAAALLRRHVRERAQDRDRADRPRGDLPLHLPRRRREPRSSTTSTTAPGSRSTRRTASSPAGRTSAAASRTAPTRMFMYATFDKPVTASGKLPASGRRRRLRQVRHDGRQDGDDADRDVADQRRPGAARTSSSRSRRPTRFESVETRAQQQWDGKLGVIEVEGATDDQLTTLYSNLYRLNLYPELGVREHRHGGEPASTSTRCSRRRRLGRRQHADADRRDGRRRQGLRQQRLLGHLPDDVAGVLAARPRQTPASWSTASSSSTATAAGSRAGPRRATRT